MKTLELTITGLYIVGCILIGGWAQKRARQSKDDYWIAGRQIGTFVNSWALMAALASGGSVLGVTALGYSLGIPYAFAMYAGAVLGFPMAGVLVAKQLRNLGKVTITDFLTSRYKSRFIQIAVPIIIVLSMGTYIIAQMKAAGVTAQFLLGIPYNQAIVLTAIVFIVYVSIGGMWAVTVTDVVQGILVVFMMLVLAITMFTRFGGVTPLLMEAARVRPQVGTLAALPLSSYIGAFVVWACAAPVIPHIVMRIYTSKDVKSARYSLNYAMLIYAVMVVFGVLGISTAGHVVFPGLKDADTLFLKMTGEFLPPIFAGLAVAAVMAAVMSTTDALLLSCASAVAHDIYEKIINPRASDRTVINIGMITTWVIGLAAMFFAFNPPKLLTMLYTAAVGLIVSSLFAPVVLGIWWKRANDAGAIAGLLAGSVSYLYTLWFMKLPSLSHILISLPLSFVVMIVVSLATARPSDDVIRMVEELHS
ncbi:MAG: sodium:solute symporter family protein [Firmicutes bacterium]|nr:sodium:solute symporter family protein [Bacillota bacterium]